MDARGRGILPRLQSKILVPSSNPFNLMLSLRVVRPISLRRRGPIGDFACSEGNLGADNREVRICLKARQIVVVKFNRTRLRPRSESRPLPSPDISTSADICVSLYAPAFGFFDFFFVRALGFVAFSFGAHRVAFFVRIAGLGLFVVVI